MGIGRITQELVSKATFLVFFFLIFYLPKTVPWIGDVKKFPHQFLAEEKKEKKNIIVEINNQIWRVYKNKIVVVKVIFQ